MFSHFNACFYSPRIHEFRILQWLPTARLLLKTKNRMSNKHKYHNVCYLVEESEHDVFHNIEHSMGYHTDPYYFGYTYNVHSVNAIFMSMFICLYGEFGIMVEIIFNWTLANRQPNNLETIICIKYSNGGWRWIGPMPICPLYI